jgi:hypothetical protein
MTQLDKPAKPIKIKDIQKYPEKYIKWMCFNLLISIDSQVFNLKLKPMAEKLIGGSYCYYCNGRYRTKRYIRENCINVFGFVYN